MESILDSVKDYLGVSPDVSAFDSDIIMSINSVLFVLTQFGIGPSEGYTISDNTNTWSEFLGSFPAGGIKEYVKMRTRLLFDPPDNNQIMSALKEQIAEFEWRLLAEADKLSIEEASNVQV